MDNAVRSENTRTLTRPKFTNPRRQPARRARSTAATTVSLLAAIPSFPRNHASCANMYFFRTRRPIRRQDDEGQNDRSSWSNYKRGRRITGRTLAFAVIIASDYAIMKYGRPGLTRIRRDTHGQRNRRGQRLVAQSYSVCPHGAEHRLSRRQHGI